MRAALASILCSVLAAGTVARAEPLSGALVPVDESSAVSARAQTGPSFVPIDEISAADAPVGVEPPSDPIIPIGEIAAASAPVLPEASSDLIAPIGGFPGAGVPVRAGTASSLLIPALEVPAINLTIWAFDRFVLDADYARISLASIRSNVTGSWTVDADSFEVNQFGHPYQGALSFTAARSAGFGFWGSALFPVAGSLMWELAMETDPPSVNDQITTPFAGALLGEALHRLSSLVLYDPSGKPGVSQEILAVLVNPMRAFNRLGMGLRIDEELQPPAAFVGQFLVGSSLGGGASHKSPSGDPIVARAGRMLKLGVRLEYGIPGPELRLERPFDHFGFDAELNLAAQPFGVLAVRGLLWGGAWSMGSHNGLGGLFALYDFFNPTPFRISSSGLGLGTTNVVRLGPRTRLMLTAIVGGVALGAAGLSESKKIERDYHFGPGITELFLARLLLGGTVSFEVSARHHLLSGQRVQKGWESILQVDVRGQLRVYGNHGIGIRCTYNDRAARFTSGVGRPQVEQQGTLVRLYWSWRIGGVRQHWDPS